MKKAIIAIGMILLAQSIASAGDPEIDRIDADFANYKRYIDSQLAQGFINQTQAQALYSEKLEKSKTLRAKRMLFLQNPQMAVVLENEAAYLEKMEKLKDEGKITEVEFQDRVQATKHRVMDVGQKQQAINNQRAYMMADIKHRELVSQRNQRVSREQLRQLKRQANQTSLNCTTYDMGLGASQTSCH